MNRSWKLLLLKSRVETELYWQLDTELDVKTLDFLSFNFSDPLRILIWRRIVIPQNSILWNPR